MIDRGEAPDENGHDHAHDAAPPGFRDLFVPDQALRGIGLALLGGGIAAAGFKALRRFGLRGVPFGLTAIAAAAVSGWAAVVHLTGGEKFDDHPFV